MPSPAFFSHLFELRGLARVCALGLLCAAFWLLAGGCELASTPAPDTPRAAPSTRSAVASAPAPVAPHEPSALEKSPTIGDWSVPASYQGQIVRNRVRHFPRKLLALTFDDGPSASVTPRILDTLLAHGAAATFFVLGNAAKQHPQLLRRMLDEGHAVGNHSYSHPERSSATEAEEELVRTQEVIKAATGRAPTCFRPPYGITDNALTRAARERRLAIVLWTISSADTRPIGARIIASNVIHTPNPGDIVLMHDGPGHEATADALEAILRELGAAGFRFVTVPELIRAWDEWQSTSAQSDGRSSDKTVR